MNLSKRTKTIIQFYAKEPTRIFKVKQVVNATGVEERNAIAISKRLEQQGYIESKEVKAKFAINKRYKISLEGLALYHSFTEKDARESIHNRTIREDLVTYIEAYIARENITKAGFAVRVSENMPLGKELSPSYCADLLAGRRNMITESLIAFLNTLNLQITPKPIRVRVD